MSVDHAFCCLCVLKSLVVPNSSASYIGLCMEWGSFGHEQLIRAAAAAQQPSDPSTHRSFGQPALGGTSSMGWPSM